MAVAPATATLDDNVTLCDAYFDRMQCDVREGMLDVPPGSVSLGDWPDASREFESDESVELDIDTLTCLVADEALYGFYETLTQPVAQRCVEPVPVSEEQGHVQSRVTAVAQEVSSEQQSPPPPPLLLSPPRKKHKPSPSIETPQPSSPEEVMGTPLHQESIKETARVIFENSRPEIADAVPGVFAGGFVQWLPPRAAKPQWTEMSLLVQKLASGRGYIPAHAMLCYRQVSDGTAVFGNRDTVKRCVNTAQYYLKPELRLSKFRLPGSFPPSAVKGGVGVTQVSTRDLEYSKTTFLYGMSRADVDGVSHCQKCGDPKAATIRKIVHGTATPTELPLGPFRGFSCKICVTPVRAAKEAATAMMGMNYIQVTV